MQALILTGGQGTRLRPLTLTTPKPLLPIANQPFLNYPLAMLRAAGVKRVVLCAAGSSLPYKALIAAQKKLGTTLVVSEEKTPLGTAGALKNAEKFLTDDDFFVLNGDVLTDVPLAAMAARHKKNQAAVSIATIAVPDPSAFGVVVSSQLGRIERFVEKPQRGELPEQKHYWVNAGIYLFERRVLSRIPVGRAYSVERELYPSCLRENLPMFAFAAPTKTYWLDIGTPEKFLKANLDVFALQDSFLKWARPQELLGKSRVHPTAKLLGRVVIAKNCRIGANAVVENSVLLDGVSIANDAEVKGAVLGLNVSIGHNAKIFHTQVLGDHSLIAPYSKL